MVRWRFLEMSLKLMTFGTGWTLFQPFKDDSDDQLLTVHIPDYQTEYRGWFVNDELLIRGWKDRDSQRFIWQRVFLETALRVGCNVIVPGTDVQSQIKS